MLFDEPLAESPGKQDSLAVAETAEPEPGTVSEVLCCTNPSLLRTQTNAVSTRRDSKNAPRCICEVSGPTAGEARR